MATLNFEDILRQADYYISIEEISIDAMSIYVSWLKKEYIIEHILGENETLIKCCWSNKILHSPNYAVKDIIDSIIRKICIEHVYPPGFVIKENNPDIFTKNFPKQEDFHYIYDNILKNGLQPHHIKLSQETNLYGGIKVLLKSYYEIED